MALALIDYGAGNLRSVANALKAAGGDDVTITADPAVVARADRIVLPGVGSFRACAQGLRGIPGLIATLEQRVLGDGVPFLGICVGMQLLATEGHEHGVTAGLGWIAGAVRALAAALPNACEDGPNPAQNPLKSPPIQAIKVPHMGWNQVTPTPAGRAHGIAPGEAYFLHSYHFVPDQPEAIAAMSAHGVPIVAAAARDNILGVQFHPEKSQAYGLALLARFLGHTR